MPPNDDVTNIIGQLIAVHGEGGICPTADDWRAIFALQDQGPIHILNLLKFKPQIDTPTGLISGAAAYAAYGSGVAGAFARAGGQRIFFGRVGHIFASGAAGDWDAAVVTRYPSPHALAAMWLDPEFIAAHDSRVDGVSQSQVLVFGQ